MSSIQTNLKLTWYDPVSRFMYSLLENTVPPYWNSYTFLEFIMSHMKYPNENKVLVVNRLA